MRFSESLVATRILQVTFDFQTSAFEDDIIEAEELSTAESMRLNFTDYPVPEFYIIDLNNISI